MPVNGSLSADAALARTSPLPAVGVEWLVDARGCAEELLADGAAARAACDDVIARMGLCVVGQPVWHQFAEPGGVTGLYLLSESHLTCHTFPEHGLATFNLYCCRRRGPCDWEAILARHLGAGDVSVREVTRGLQPGGGR